MEDKEQLLFPHGGYRKLKSFQLAQLCFDITVRFVELYIPPKSRTTDQMVQAARSGVQNIAEGSVASATSKRTKLKLTNVARASLEELRLDYEDYLCQHAITVWSKEHPLTQEFIDQRISSMEEFRTFVQNSKQHPSMSVHVRYSPFLSMGYWCCSMLPVISFLLCKKKSTDSKPYGLPSAALTKDGGCNRTRIYDLHDVNGIGFVDSQRLTE